MKRGTIEHPKTLELAEALGVPLFAAVGILESVWHWTARYAPAGDIGRWSNKSIATGIGWPVEDADRLVESLFQSHWLDEHDDHRLVVHDWSEHCDDWVHGILARSKAFFCDGSKPKIPFQILSKKQRKEIETFYRSTPPPEVKPPRSHQATTGSATPQPLGNQAGLAWPGLALPRPGQAPRTVSAESETTEPPRTSAAAEERERSAQSASAGTGNGSEAELEPDDPTRATVGRVLERWAQRFPDLPIENANDRGELMHDLEARIREWPDLGEWEHAFDQLERQPFLRRGLNRQRGPATLAFIVHDTDTFAGVKRRKFEPDRPRQEAHAR